MSDLAVGVDGWRGGWVAIVLQDGGFAAAELFETFRDVLAKFSGAGAIGIDIPIGIPDEGLRPADREARVFLGAGSSSVFSVPVRAALEATDHASASTLLRSMTGKGLTQQSFALRKKILEVDALVKADDNVVEVHPEVSFKALAGAALRASKKTWAGANRRRDLLAGEGIVIPSDIGEAGKAPVDDILDAGAAAWSAQRYARGEAEALPARPLIDRRGRHVAIWF
jgi:predicted RNase H-like nuclease